MDTEQNKFLNKNSSAKTSRKRRKSLRSTETQVPISFHRRGGPRKGAGRKPNGPKAGTPHLKRPPLNARFPVHVTLKVMNHVYNLRSKRCFSKILRSIHAARNRFGFRVVHYSVQGDHFHFIVEAANRKSLSRGMQGLTIRIAKALNKVMERKGKVFADRYHARILRTPSEVRNAVAYVLKNGLRHSRSYKKVFPQGWIDPFSSFLFFWEIKTGKTLGAVFKTVRKRGVLRVVERGVRGTGPPRAGPWDAGLDVSKGLLGRTGSDDSDAGCFYDNQGRAHDWISDFFYHRSGLCEREVVSPRTWLLSVGWRKAGDVDITTIPGKL